MSFLWEIIMQYISKLPHGTHCWECNYLLYEIGQKKRKKEARPNPKSHSNLILNNRISAKQNH